MTMIRTRNLRLAGIRLYGKEEIQMYLFGGKGRFILKSAATGISYEYRIKQPRKTIFNGYGTIPNPKFDENTMWVTVKTDYGFKLIGTLKVEENKYIHSKKSTIDEKDSIVKGIKWLIYQFNLETEFPTEMEFYHMGTCGCCARSLTTPGSIKMGIGPICFERYGSERMKKLLVLKKKMEQRMKKNKITL